MANEGYHEPIEELSDETRDMHRAITSLMEEIEAVDWYNQRVNLFHQRGDGAMHVAGLVTQFLDGLVVAFVGHGLVLLLENARCRVQRSFDTQTSTFSLQADAPN